MVDEKDVQDTRSLHSGVIIDGEYRIAGDGLCTVIPIRFEMNIDKPSNKYKIETHFKDITAGDVRYVECESYTDGNSTPTTLEEVREVKHRCLAELVAIEPQRTVLGLIRLSYPVPLLQLGDILVSYSLDLVSIKYRYSGLQGFKSIHDDEDVASFSTRVNDKVAGALHQAAEQCNQYSEKLAQLPSVDQEYATFESVVLECQAETASHMEDISNLPETEPFVYALTASGTIQSFSTATESALVDIVAIQGCEDAP